MRPSLKRVIRSQPRCGTRARIAQRQAALCERLVVARVFVGQRARPAQCQDLLPHQAAQREYACLHIDRAVVAAAARQVEHFGCDLADIPRRCLRNLIPINRYRTAHHAPGESRNSHSLASSRIFDCGGAAW